MKKIRFIVPLLIVSIIISSCSLFPTQKMIDNIIPDYNKRMYTVADLIPYDYKEIKNARALYGQELTKFFNKNTTTASELTRVTEKEKMAFYKELLYRTHNYKTMKQMFSMYVDDTSDLPGTKEAERKKEFDEYYAVQNAAAASFIKKYNDGKLNGMPLISIRAIMGEATDSNCDIYAEVPCEIYEPVVISEEIYDNLKFGDSITLEVPATSSTALCKDKYKVECVYIATDSLLIKKNENSDSNSEKYYFIADVDGTTGVHRVLDYYGGTLETYIEKRKLQFMKHCRVAEANDSFRLMSSVVNDELVSYEMNDLVEKALCGGYVVQEYKDYVYANSVYTDRKGYITSLINYTNQRVDNEFYDSLY